MSHHNCLTTPHRSDADLSVKDHVLKTQESCVILGSKALARWVLFVLISMNTSMSSRGFYGFFPKVGYIDNCTFTVITTWDICTFLFTLY